MSVTVRWFDVTEQGRRPVLVLEAGSENRERIAALCEQHGYILDAADSVDDALVALRESQHLVVILDVSRPT